MEHRKRMASGLAASAVFAAVLAFTVTRDVQAGVQKLKANDAFSSPEWVDGLEQAEDAEQLLVVAGIGETTAYISMHEKNEDGAWNEIMTTPGFIGKKGLGKEKEGDAKTPVGTFSFNHAFGIAEDPGCAIPYQQVTEDNYWSGDTRDGYCYNEMVCIADYPDLNTEDSEHLIEYKDQYQYCLNISYNEEGTPGLGSAIFLHCLGPVKPYTGGCIAIPKDKMLLVMKNVREDCVVVIDSLENISPELYEELGLAPEEPEEEETEAELSETAPEPETALRTYSVAETPRETLDVEGIFVGDTITVSEEPVVSFSGSVSKENAVQSFSYTAPRNGTYRVDLTDVNAKADILLTLRKANGETVFKTYYGGDDAYLYENETYDILVEYYSGSSDFTLNIGVQKPTTDISAATVINDQISYEDQINRYVFTAPMDGKYRFDLTEVNANNKLRLMMWDHLDNNIMATYDNGENVTLTAGETYTVQVRQYDNTGSYKMTIGFPKPTLDITGFGVVSDSIEFEEQRNRYLFTAPIDGRYRFDLTEVNANNTFRLMMWDHLENKVMDTYYGGGYVVLDAGETYELQVRHYSGYGTYKLAIGYQKESVDLSELDVVYDRITFADQKNVYYYTPSVSGSYTLRLADYDASCTLELMAWDNFDIKIVDTYYDEETLNLEAGITYVIQVRQYSGYTGYSLNIAKN